MRSLLFWHFRQRKLVVPDILRQLSVFLISNFRRVLNVVCFLLGNSPASELYMPTFRNTQFHLHGRIGVEWLCLRNVRVFIGKRGLVRKWPEAIEGGWQGRGGSSHRAGRRKTTHMEARGWYGKQILLVLGWNRGWQKSDYCVCPSLAVAQDGHLQRVTIPETAYVQFVSLISWWRADCARNM